MKYINKQLGLIILLFIVHLTVAGQDLKYGLIFNSYEVEKEFRTGLNLTPDAPLSLPDIYSISFDINFRQAYHKFGYILRMISSDNEHLDFLLNRPDGSSQNTYLTFVDNNGKNFYRSSMNDIGIAFDKWINIKITFDTKNDNFIIFIDSKFFLTQNMPLKGFRKPYVFFGKNNYPLFQTSDIASMIISDVKIENESDKLLYNWKLSKHRDNGVLDEIKSHFALCENPNWIINKYASWNKKESFKTQPNPQITFNIDKGNVAVIDKTHLYEYNIRSEKLDTLLFKAGVPLGYLSNQLIYNPSTKKYITYNFNSIISEFDTLTHTWNNERKDVSGPRYWHHNRYLSTKDNKLYTFGGYGYHTYNNDLNIIDLTTGLLSKHPLQTEKNIIYPRYLSGLGVLDNSHVILFGGYGSETGNQELVPKNFYDLFKINIQSLEIEKIWELDPLKNDFVLASSMVVDTTNNCFYALCYPHQKFNTTIQLYKFSLDEPAYEILADSIPYYFSDISSYADLYLNNQTNELVAITSSVHPNETMATVSIYTLMFPPLAKNELNQTIHTSGNTLYYILLLFFLLIGFVLWHIKVKKKSEKPKTIVSDSDEYNPVLGIKPINKNIDRQAIFLLGGFQVIDRDGNDITGEFTPILKQLFLLILLNTLKDGKGISSNKLKELLWYDKSEESARNNRSVGLSKLRSIFEQVGKVSIVNQTSYWTIQFEDIYCDFYEAVMLIQNLKRNKNIKDLNRLLSILLNGDLLPNLQIEWVDAFKSDLSNRIIEHLQETIDDQEYTLDAPMQINIADAILIHDSLDEKALKIKCKALVKLGRHGLAQNVYNSFAKEYQTLFGTPFKLSFEEIIA